MAKKILVIDDDLYLRELYVEVMKDAGFEVDSAKDGKDGLEKLSQGGWDLTLLDIMMPNLDGLGVLTKLAESPPAQPNGPIIILTNLSNDPSMKEALKKGATSYLIKADFIPVQLVEKAKEFLKKP
ncbi:MAG: response regulator [Patescibacteria group bacterium]